MTPDDLMPDDLNARWLHHLQEMTLTTYCCDSDGKRSKTEDDGEVLKLQMTIQTKASTARGDSATKPKDQLVQEPESVTHTASTAAPLEDLKARFEKLSINTMPFSPRQSFSPDSSITASKQDLEKTTKPRDLLVQESTYPSDCIHPPPPPPAPSPDPSTAAPLGDLEDRLEKLSVNTMPFSPGQSFSPDSSITASKQDLEKTTKPKDLLVQESELATHTTSTAAPLGGLEARLEKLSINTMSSSLGQSRSPDSSASKTWSVKRAPLSHKRETTLEKRIMVIRNQLEQLSEIVQQSSTQPIFLEECLREIQNQLDRLIFQQDTPPEQIPKIVRQPETQPISEEQLVAEVKGIYAGLVMVEGKCIQVDAKQAALAREAPHGTQPKLNNEQWQALIVLHRTLLREHHDFFLASQHPSAIPAVRRLAIKYAMPARLWRHGIHSFLELLRNRLPDSLDHMLAFIYLAYRMMTLLFETVPAFEETWIECLGDLGRYRLAIEDDDIRDREVWTQVSRQWYLKASNRAPEVGRLYHHFAILAQPNALQQLFFYGKSLSVSQPFPAAKNSVLTLLEPILIGTPTSRLPQVYIRIHAFLFMRKNIESFGGSLKEFISLLDSHICCSAQRFLEQGYYIAISNCLALLSYGSLDSVLSKALSAEDIVSTNETQTGTPESPADPFTEAAELFVQTLDINCKHIEDPNVLSFLHATLIFLLWVARFPAAMQLLERKILWGSLVHKLNSLLLSYDFYLRIEGDELPMLDCRPTPEEFAMRGLKCAEYYLSADRFKNKNVQDENQYKEDNSMNTDYRPERILWLGCQLSKLGKWFTYDNIEHKFFLGPGQTDIPIPQAVSSDLELRLEAESTTAIAAEIPSETTLVEIKETKEDTATRTCNSCIQEFPESRLVTCTTCDDFDPKRALAPAAEDMALNPLAKALLQPDHNMSHHAICDGGDKATKTNPITSPTSQGQTVANLNPSEPSKVEENKSAEAALGQEVGFTVDAPALVVKQEEKEELREFKEEEPDVVVEGSQKSQMISPQSSGNESPARSIHQYAVPSKEQHRADDFEGFVETDAEVDFLTDEEYEILTVDYGILEMSEEEAEEEEVEVQAEPIELRKDEDVDELANELENKVNI